MEESRKVVTRTETETPDTSNCQKTVQLIQTAFRDIQMPEEATWKAVVLIPK